jgi:hypothetical protein
MFLHKFDILNSNLNGLFQKFVPVVPKLCAMTKLGDLTEPFYLSYVQDSVVESEPQPQEP